MKKSKAIHSPTRPRDAEQRIRALLARLPSLSIRQIARHASVSLSTASKYARMLRTSAPAAGPRAQ